MALCAGDDKREPVAVFELGCPVTSVAWSADGATIYAGVLDNVIHVRTLLVYGTHVIIQVPNLRKQEEVSVLSGHVDTPTGLAVWDVESSKILNKVCCVIFLVVLDMMPVLSVTQGVMELTFNHTTVPKRKHVLIWEFRPFSENAYKTWEKKKLSFQSGNYKLLYYA